MSSLQEQLQTEVDTAARELNVPGVSVGIVHDGQEYYAYAGVTSVENPLDVDETTLFQFGSTGKTFTATAIMRLVDQGKVELDAPVRRYVPELKLQDESVAEKVTVLHLLNHTAGWSGDLMVDTGRGDDALAKYVALMAGLQQETPLGATVSYNNASLTLAGRVIEHVCGTTYEQAIADLILEPLGMTNTFFFMTDIMTRRFAVGHKQDPEGTVSVSRPWAMNRGNTPAGGISADSRDLITWAKFHLGDGTSAAGETILAQASLERMQESTADMAGSALGDAVGIGWLLKGVGGARVVGHGGTTLGQHSDFFLVPDRNFGLTSMANCGPNGPEFNHRIAAWALETFLGVVGTEDEAADRTDAELAEFVGSYATIATTVSLTAADGGLVAVARVRPEVLEQLGEDAEQAEQPPIPLGMLPGDGDRFVATSGPAKGMKGYFVRDERGHVTGVHLGGRLATRQPQPVGS